jgi:hypothetical protein
MKRRSSRSRTYRVVSVILTVACIALAVAFVWFGIWDGYRADATGTSAQGWIDLCGAVLVLATLVGAVWFRVRSNHV